MMVEGESENVALQDDEFNLSDNDELFKDLLLDHEGPDHTDDLMSQMLDEQSETESSRITMIFDASFDR